VEVRRGCQGSHFDLQIAMILLEGEGRSSVGSGVSISTVAIHSTGIWPTTFMWILSISVPGKALSVGQIPVRVKYRYIGMKLYKGL
jgi:hypothetical protein